MFKKLLLVVMVLVSVVGCTRIGTGEVGLRVDWQNLVVPEELQPGSFNQTMVGHVLEFPVRENLVSVENRRPQTKDNSTLDDFDLQLTYDITPSCVSDLWSKKSKGFHVHDTKEDNWILMQHYIEVLANSAIFKAVREHDALTIGDNRSKIETSVRTHINEELANDKLAECLKISQVQVRNIQLPANIVSSANDVIVQRNVLLKKEIEIQTARKEAERIAVMASNKEGIDYVKVQNETTLVNAIASGKVNVVLYPVDFKGMLNVTTPVQARPAK